MTENYTKIYNLDSRIISIGGKFKEIILKLGLDLNDPNFKDTPFRIARLYDLLLEGTKKEAQKNLNIIFSRVFPSKYTGIVAKKDLIEFTLCPHHLMPIRMDIRLAYIPKGYVLGLSKIVKAVEILSRRAILQETLTEDIADTFYKRLKCRGFMVIIKAEHYCEKLQGYGESCTITSSLRGVFEKDAAAKAEVFNLLK